MTPGGDRPLRERFLKSPRCSGLGERLGGEQGARGRVLRAPEVDGGRWLVRGRRGAEEAESGGKGS